MSATRQPGCTASYASGRLQERNLHRNARNSVAVAKLATQQAVQLFLNELIMVGVFLVVRFALRCRLLFGIVIIKSERTSDRGMYEETVLAKP